jgi:DNA-binding transcriptional LysR family regulator
VRVVDEIASGDATRPPGMASDVARRLESRVMWEHVELREIRVFLTLCEELHFGRTAERLRISQTRVSQTIQELEAKIGAPLFERTSRHVALTGGGARLHEEVVPAYEQMTGVLRRAHAASGEITGTLRVGQLTAPSGGPRLLRIVEAFSARHPACEVEVSSASLEDPFGDLRRGEMDLMASWLPLEQPDLVVGPVLFSEQRVLLVSRDHPLAGLSEVSLEDLADYRVPRMPRIPNELHEVWFPSRTPSGRVIPSVELHLRGQDVGHLAARIARREFVHPTVPSTARYLADPSLVCVPINGLPPLRSGLVWRRGSKDPRVVEFARVAAEAVGAETDRAVAGAR